MESRLTSEEQSKFFELRAAGSTETVYVRHTLFVEHDGITTTYKRYEIGGICYLLPEVQWLDIAVLQKKSEEWKSTASASATFGAVTLGKRGVDVKKMLTIKAGGCCVAGAIADTIEITQNNHTVHYTAQDVDGVEYFVPEGFELVKKVEPYPSKQRPPKPDGPPAYYF